MEQFRLNYPNDPLWGEVTFRLGQLYEDMQNFRPAISAFKAVLALPPDNIADFRAGEEFAPNLDSIIDFNYAEDEITCPPIVKSQWNWRFQRESCSKLADLYIYRERYDSSIYYFNLKAQKYAFTNCGNGYRADLASCKFEIAKIYLLEQDTSRALGALFDRILFTDYPQQAEQLLIDLLQTLYSAEAIQVELDKAINEAYIYQKNGWDYPHITLFGFELKEGDLGDMKDTEQFRAYLRKSTWVRQLRRG